ncbi:DUF3276 family protein [Luteibaculum oceani]|uniref:DUF3276 family protein n=1 Tax=Luteibaculum oceani TaxID=1294296 RepID=A0A5C6VBJ9_9FLAO|nr:DUF3276 family protein [Luteibaculum oceani]TXC82011.1 DUF3276 family protein [Luteibaculum oceani]
MAEGKENRQDIYSKSVRAGKRTYFFDIKSTKSNDLYLTITESKKRFQEDGKFYFEKHKLFLYKEDFEKFVGGLEEAIDKIKSLQENPDNEFMAADEHASSEKTTENNKEEDDLTKSSKAISDINFDDLG